jgi:hypothetical protein
VIVTENRMTSAMATLKQHLKRSLGRHWSSLVRLRRSKAIRRLKALPSAPIKLWRQKTNGQYFPVIICSEMGMGSLLVHVLRLLRHADQCGLTPIIRVRNPLYATAAEPDLLETYLAFKPPDVDHRVRFHTVSCEEDYAVFGVEMAFGILEANTIFKKYLGFNADILAQCRQILVENGGDFVIAVHYRGTDKIYETPKAPANQIIATCGSLLSATGARSAFLATDEPEFAKAIIAAFPSVRFLSFDYEGEMTPGTPRHFSTLSPPQKAVEALVNLSLLSHAAYLIRTPSFLSGVSCLLNTSIYPITIPGNSKMEAFPERQIIEMQRSKAKRNYEPPSMPTEGT